MFYEFKIDFFILVQHKTSFEQDVTCAFLQRMRALVYGANVIIEWNTRVDKKYLNSKWNI